MRAAEPPVVAAAASLRYALEQIAQRFHLARKRLGLSRERQALRTDLFRPPVLAGQQMRLF